MGKKLSDNPELLAKILRAYCRNPDLWNQIAKIFASGDQDLIACFRAATKRIRKGMDAGEPCEVVEADLNRIREEYLGTRIEATV